MKSRDEKLTAIIEPSEGGFVISVHLPYIKSIEEFSFDAV